MSNNAPYVCADCGLELTQDKFVDAVCPGCGGLRAIPRQAYDAQPERPERPTVEFVVGSESVTAQEKGEPEAWICAGELVEARQ